MRDQAGGLQIVEPALHALAMRAHKPRPLGPAGGTAPQPITGANPTTSCSTEHANRPDRAACPSRNRYRLTAYTRVSRRSSPGVLHPRARRARESSAHTMRRPGSGGSGSRAGRYQRRRATARPGEERCSSGTASARAHASRAGANAGEQTLAAQLAEPAADGVGAIRRTTTRPPEQGLRIRPQSG